MKTYNTFFVEFDKRHVEQEPVIVLNDKEGSKFDAGEMLRAMCIKVEPNDEVYLEVRVVSRLRTVREPVK